MKIIELSTWEEFLSEHKKLQAILEQRRLETGFHVDEPLYRGQAKHEWLLETTLERFGRKKMPLHDYYLAALKSKHAIETYTDKSWNIPGLEEYDSFLRETDTFMMAGYPGYEYLVYLRHYGFPSPMLDWSFSPFVAAFFAFDSANESAPDSRVAIFAFCEFFGSAKIAAARSPLIQTRGPYATCHPRHFKQQSSYTFCTARSDKWYYASHEEALTVDDKSQDLLWKFTIPSTERRKVLRYLDSHNLNAYSLFNSEESLMSTMAIRELYLNAPAT